MEISPNYTSKFKNGRKNTEDQALASEICRSFPSINSTAMYWMIRRKGRQFVRETFYEVIKHSNARNPTALFLWKLKQVSVQMSLIPPKS